MDIEAAIPEKRGLWRGAWDWLKAVKGKFVSFGKSVRKLGQDDPRRITHSLKAGLALTLVSLFYYSRTLYNSFGMSGIWAVLTVVVVFEFTVGGTLSRCVNRGVATLIAGALGVGSHSLASLFGKKGEPVVLGIIVFLLAAASTFTRFVPRIKARYDYGVLIFILTFSLVTVSGYRVDELIELAHQRLSTILIGGATCVLVSTCIRPVWAGEELHKLIISNMEKLANYLEGFSGVYFQCCQDGKSGAVSIKDKSFLQGNRSVFNSKASEETMANLASWEPRHGKFKLKHPWRHYLKIGALLRQCACHIEALNGYVQSDIQAPEEFLRIIQETCTKMSGESSKALKCLASAIKTMTNPSLENINIEEAKKGIVDLKSSLKVASPKNVDLQQIGRASIVALLLVEIVKCVDQISESVHELSKLAHFKDAAEPNVSPGKPQLLHRGIVNPVLDDGCDNHVVITVHELISTDSPENKNPEVPKPDKD